MKLIQINNQKPVVFNQLVDFMATIDPAKDPDTYVAELTEHVKKTFVQPLYEPINPQSPVEIIVDLGNGNVALSIDDLTGYVLSLLTNNYVNNQLEDFLKEIYTQSMRYNVSNRLPFDTQLILESFGIPKLPVVSSKTRYKWSTDVIPSAKDLLIDWTDDTYKHTLIASLYGTITQTQASRECLIVYLKSDDIYKQIQTKIAPYGSNTILKPDVLAVINSIKNIQFDGSDATTTWLLPQNDPYSEYAVNRIVYSAIADIIAPDTGFVSTHNVSNIINATAVVFVSVESLAHSSTMSLNREFNDIERALTLTKQIPVANRNVISSAKLVSQSITKRQSPAPVVSTGNRTIERKARIHLRTKPLTNQAQIGLIYKLMNQATTTIQSQNQYKTKRKTGMRPNRRQSTNQDLLGVINKTSYRPDIHVYVDTSGSISEENYQSTVMNLIKLARKSKVNMYFTSFSHILSDETLIKVQGKSAKRLYQEIQNIPKVSGGTDFENVWLMIEEVAKVGRVKGHAPRLNFIVSDFEYYPKNTRMFPQNATHVENTFYVPITCEPYEYANVRHCAKNLIDTMVSRGDANARKRFIM